jgi:hypothetical protein
MHATLNKGCFRADSITQKGGYNLTAIASSALAVTRVLLGEAPPRIKVLNVMAVATQTIWEVARVQKQYWDILDVPACEPAQGGISLISIDVLLIGYVNLDRI